MRTVTHREMRNNSGEILRAVAAGDTVQVTNGGVVAAVIVSPGADVVDDLVERGLARPAESSLASLRLIQRTTSRRTSAEILADSRGRW